MYCHCIYTTNNKHTQYKFEFSTSSELTDLPCPPSPQTICQYQMFHRSRQIASTHTSPPWIPPTSKNLPRCTFRKPQSRPTLPASSPCTSLLRCWVRMWHVSVGGTRACTTCARLQWNSNLGSSQLLCLMTRAVRCWQRTRVCGRACLIRLKMMRLIINVMVGLAWRRWAMVSSLWDCKMGFYTHTLM